MTKEVTRYTQPCVQTQPGPEFQVAEVPLFEDPKGKWVRWEDYASLKNAYEQMVRHHAKAHGVPVVEPTEDVRALFNKGLGVQKGNKFSFSFETEEEANRAFHYIAELGTLETSQPPQTAEKVTAEPVKYGCHCDLENMDEGYEPDGCVIDEGHPDSCIYAGPLVRQGKDKSACKYWLPIKPRSAVNRGAPRND